MNEQVNEEITDGSIPGDIGDEVYSALQQMSDELYSMLSAYLDERLQVLMSFLVSSFSLLIGFLAGVALWLTLKDSK